MKFLHLADLHIGKKLNEYPLFDDQKHVLRQAIALAKREKVDAIVIAGDVYDSSAPSAEAMDCYNDFISELFALGKPVLMISGNHDSPERLNVASSILRHSGVYIVTKLEDAVKPIRIEGVDFYLMPFFRPSDVNRLLGADCHSYEAAMKALLQTMSIDLARPNVLVTHQAILPLQGQLLASGSETSVDMDNGYNVGGSDAIDASLFHSFDYLALGHIHKAQNIGHNARYCGAMLKYHVKEASAKRTFTIVEMEGKKVKIRESAIRPLRDLVILSGTLEEILTMTGHENDYVHCRLQDESYVDGPLGKLKAKYPYCLGLEYPRLNPTTTDVPEVEDVEEIGREELFARF